MSGKSVKVSVVVVIAATPWPLADFYREYSAPLRASGFTFEFVFVTPADRRSMLESLFPLCEQGEPIQLFELAHNVGEAALLRSALPHVRGDTLLLLSADSRVAASGLPDLVRAIDDGADLVVARREVTGDALTNRVQRRLAHALVSALVGGTFHDLGSGARAIRREVLAELPLYGEFSRFLPLFASRDGFVVEERSVPQHPAGRRGRLYSPGIYVRRLLDVLAVFFLIRFREKPLRFFGLVGGVVSVTGLLILAVLGWQRLTGTALADRPMLVVGVLLLVLGAQGVALGLIGEIIVHTGGRRRITYRLAPPKRQ